LHRKILEDHWFAREFAAKRLALDVFFVRTVKAMQGNSWCTKNNIGVQGKSIPTVPYNREGMKRASSPVEL